MCKYLQRMGHVTIFLGRPVKLHVHVNQCCLYMRIWFTHFHATVLKRKRSIKLMVASLKTLTNSRNCSESRIRISVLVFLLSHWLIFSRDDIFGIFLGYLYLYSWLHQRIEKEKYTLYKTITTIVWWMYSSFGKWLYSNMMPGTGPGSCPAFPFRSTFLDHVGGCPR